MVEPIDLDPSGWINRLDCMGEGRTVPIDCLNDKNEHVRSWKVRPEGGTFCAVWFCCSGDKGGYSAIYIPDYGILNCTLNGSSSRGSEAKKEL